MQACFDFIFLAVNLAVPLVLAAEAAMIAERSGVICLGVEGIMIFGAFFAVTGSYYTGNPWLGVLLAVAGGALAGWIYTGFWGFKALLHPQHSLSASCVIFKM